MCGILGSIGSFQNQEVFERALQSLKHRGPNDVGVFSAKGGDVLLGHRRLSIIDLTSAGKQPFMSNDGRYAVVFNGEIYNYLEIKQELVNLYDFKTKTDTEVLLAAYIVWGEKCVQKFNGMFAFAVWDNKDEVLFCARDRMGEKPFFYSNQNGRFLFASEIKALLVLGVKKKVNERIVFDYLYHGLYDHTAETFFEDVYALPPAHFVVVKDGKVHLERYWHLKDAHDQSIGLTETEVKEKFQHLLEESINLRLRSDVPVGINLSSGLDSNALYYYSQRISGKFPPIFSMCLPSEEFNECSIISDFLTQDQKTSWYTSSISPDEVFGLAAKMNLIQDQPYGGIPTIAYGKLNEVAQKEKVTVILEGQGLDEILAGYKYYRIEHEKDVTGIESENSSVFYSQDMTKLIYTDLLDKEFVARSHRELSFETPFSSHLLNAQYRDLHYAKLPRVLRFNDHATMAYGTELRLPYLDHRIVEFCFWLPAKYKMNESYQKVLMRDIMSGLLPKAVSSTQKKSFGAVQTEWFRNFYQKQVLAVITSDSFKQRGYWNAELLLKTVQDFYSGQGENSFFMWQCINLEMWFRSYID